MHRKKIILNFFHSDDVNSKLYISFKQPHFLALNRVEAYTISDFMASCGGLLGLYMGISLLSIFKLIYYFTLRFWCTSRYQESTNSDSTWAKRKHISALKRQLRKIKCLPRARRTFPHTGRKNIKLS